MSPSTTLHVEAAFQAHRSSVVARARQVTRNPAMAEDVAQEVFARLWDAPDRYEADRGGVLSYLMAQTHGRSVDLIRSESARRRREDLVGRRDVAPSNPDEKVIDHEQAESVRRALTCLSTDQRQAIELAFFGGLSYRQVARRLGSPEGTVKARIRAGLRLLAGELAWLR